MLFKDNSIGQTIDVWMNMKLGWIVAAVIAALSFVCLEGFIIWKLLHIKDYHVSAWKCFRYSFVGFFFSGITPSATGGQPVQLYCMNKDRIKLSDSTAILMTVGIMYKFVLVLQGIILRLVWGKGLRAYLGNYIYLFWFGLFLNIIVVLVLGLIMLKPRIFTYLVMLIEKFLVRIHLLKAKPERKVRLQNMVKEYGETVQFFVGKWKYLLLVLGFTFLQRTILFLPTYFVYRGMGFAEENIWTVLILQASVYVAVDMLPLPGAQGISEIMYKQVFGTIFTGEYLIASAVATRGIMFYFLLIVSGTVAGIFYLKNRNV